MGTGSTTGDGLWDIPIPQNEVSQTNDGPTAKNQIANTKLTQHHLKN